LVTTRPPRTKIGSRERRLGKTLGLRVQMIMARDWRRAEIPMPLMRGASLGEFRSLR
jgi:hypothetical protein